MLKLACVLVGALPVAASGAGVACGGSKSTCPQASDCCVSKYSPSKFGCLVQAADVVAASGGCGDGLAGDADGNVCCKMGPADAPSTTLPNVLIIGDSVSIGYTTLASQSVPALLKTEAQVQHGPWDVSDGGAGDTAEGVVCLDRWLMTQESEAVKWDAITFNFGLHDLTNTSHCEGLYEAQLTNITRRLHAVTDNLLYVTTTPFMPLRTQGNTVVEDMNAIARRVVAPFNVTVVDLYKTVADHCGPIPYVDCDICRVHPCSYHYDTDGENMQAAVLAAAIRAALAASKGESGDRHHQPPVRSDLH